MKGISDGHEKNACNGWENYIVMFTKGIFSYLIFGA
jgi:hypothetical protein